MKSNYKCFVSLCTYTVIASLVFLNSQESATISEFHSNSLTVTVTLKI